MQKLAVSKHDVFDGPIFILWCRLCAAVRCFHVKVQGFSWVGSQWIARCVIGFLAEWVNTVLVAARAFNLLTVNDSGHSWACSPVCGSWTAVERQQTRPLGGASS